MISANKVIGTKLQVRTKLTTEQIQEIVTNLDKIGVVNYNYNCKVIYADSALEFSEKLFNGGIVLLGKVEFGTKAKPEVNPETLKNYGFPSFALDKPAAVLLPSKDVLVYDPITGL